MQVMADDIGRHIGAVLISNDQYSFCAVSSDFGLSTKLKRKTIGLRL